MEKTQVRFGSLLVWELTQHSMLCEVLYQSSRNVPLTLSLLLHAVPALDCLQTAQSLHAVALLPTPSWYTSVVVLGV